MGVRIAHCGGLGRWVAAALAVAAACGCTDRDMRFFTFEVTETLPQSAVAGNPVGGALTSGPSPLSSNMRAESEFQQQDIDHVARIALSDLRFTIAANSTDTSTDMLEDGNPDNFDFVTTVDVYIEATIAGEPRSARVAFLPSDDPQVGAGSTTMVLRTTDTDILPYTEAAGGYTLRLDLTGAIPPDDVIFDGQATFEVIAGVDRD